MLTDMAANTSTSMLCDEIKSILPSLEETDLVCLMEKFTDLGVETVADLSLLQEKDLEGVLKPIQIRKILTFCGKQVSDVQMTVTRGSSSSEPSSPGSAGMSMSPLSSTSSTCSSPNIFENSSNTDPNWAHKIPIPWAKIGNDLRGPLQAGKRLVPDSRRKLVRVVVDEVREKSFHATKKQFSTIAKNIVQRFPASLEDKIDGTLIGSGYDSFLKQMLNRNDNLNRPVNNPNKSSRSRPTSDTEEVLPTQDEAPVTQKKADCYGCINSAPNIVGDMENLERMKLDMCLPNSSQNTFDWQIVEQQIADTYSLQRKEINEACRVRDLVVKWPFLFTERGLFQHFKLLVGLDLKVTINDAFLCKAPRLCKFFETEEPSIGELINKTRQKMPHDNMITLLPVNILAVMKFFSEKEDALFLVADETSTRKDVEAMDTLGSAQLVCLGQNILDAKKFMILVDGVVVISDLNSFLSSLSALFALFYVLNVQYQEGALATLEFIQRCFVGLNPDRGTKGNQGKKRKSTCAGGVNAKVLRLINKLANFEWTTS